jgi:hypothetical protein
MLGRSGRGVQVVGENVSVDVEIDLLAKMREALEAHSTECCQRPKAILLHPANYELIGWDEVLGLPVLPDPRVEPGQAKLLCGDKGWGGFFEGEPVWWTADGTAHRRVETETLAS